MRFIVASGAGDGPRGAHDPKVVNGRAVRFDPRFDDLSPQQGTELRRRVLLHRGQGMSVDVVRDVGLRVAEPLRNDLDRNTGLQCQGRARVPHSVELDPPDTGRFD